MGFNPWLGQDFLWAEPMERNRAWRRLFLIQIPTIILSLLRRTGRCTRRRAGRRAGRGAGRCVGGLHWAQRHRAPALSTAMSVALSVALVQHATLTCACAACTSFDIDRRFWMCTALRALPAETRLTVYRGCEV